MPHNIGSFAVYPPFRCHSLVRLHAGLLTLRGGIYVPTTADRHALVSRHAARFLTRFYRCGAFWFRTTPRVHAVQHAAFAVLCLLLVTTTTLAAATTYPANALHTDVLRTTPHKTYTPGPYRRLRVYHRRTNRFRFYLRRRLPARAFCCRQPGCHSPTLPPPAPTLPPAFTLALSIPQPTNYHAFTALPHAPDCCSAVVHHLQRATLPHLPSASWDVLPRNLRFATHVARHTHFMVCTPSSGGWRFWFALRFATPAPSSPSHYRTRVAVPPYTPATLRWRRVGLAHRRYSFTLRFDTAHCHDGG